MWRPISQRTARCRHRKYRSSGPCLETSRLAENCQSQFPALRSMGTASPSPPASRNLSAAAHVIIAAMEITWLGHGTFQFVLPGGETLILDPWTDGNPAYPKGFEITRCDTILVSHGHFDHIHDAVPLAKKFKANVVAIYETCHWLGRKGVETCQ